MESAESEQPFPHSIEAEQLVLGAVLAENKGRDAVLDTLRPADFYVPEHRRIFEKLSELRAANKSLDLLTVDDELRREGQLENVGGIAYLAKLGDGMPQGFNLSSAIQLIRGKAILRAVIHAARVVQQSALESTDEAAVLDQAVELFSNLARDWEADEDTGKTFRDAAVSLLGNLGKQQGVRVYTDVDGLDKLIGGFRPGELVLFTAETGVGKTLLAQQTRRRACRDGFHSLYASAEMLAEHLVSRELATEAGVAHLKMRRDDLLDDSDWKRLTKATARECTRCRILDGELTMRRIRRAARAMKAREGLELVVLDYDELITSTGENELEQQRNLVRESKSLAMELCIPVIMISQLRKALQGEDRKRPTLQRLYGSGAKPKHASIVIYVDREFVQDLRGDETAARILVLKSRDGRLRALDAKFNVETLRFESLPAKRAVSTAEVGE